MNEVERAKLVELLTATWPTGPRARIWSDAVEQLDHGHAHSAYRRMRDTVSRGSVADLLTLYRVVVDEAHAAYRYQRLPCEHCDDTGWVTVRSLVVNDGTDRRREYRQCAPCDHCDEGRARIAVQRAIDDARARHPTARAVNSQSELR